MEMNGYSKEELDEVAAEQKVNPITLTRAYRRIHGKLTHKPKFSDRLKALNRATS